MRPWAVWLLGCSVSLAAPAQESADDQEALLVARVVREMRALDPAIQAVRPGRVHERARTGFELLWSPSLTLKPGTSLARQKQVARKAAAYVVELQGGVPIDTHGGILCFLEGDGWYPEIGTVAYRHIREGFREDYARPMREQLQRVPPTAIEVRLDLRQKDAQGRPKGVCCDEGEMIGTIVDKRFVPLPRRGPAASE
jgi:hypothetical protein